MQSPVRARAVAAALAAAVAGGAALSSAAVAAPNAAKHAVKRFNMAGYVIDTRYTQGRNTGNTFEQTYRAKTVLGVPIAGPYVGTKFPRENYVAMAIGHHEVYVAWIDTKAKDALVDVFVMNFATHRVYDYAPGSLKPESIGTIVVKRRGHKVP